MLATVHKSARPVYATEDVAEILRISPRSARRSLTVPPLARYAFRRGRRLYILARDLETAFAARRGRINEARNGAASREEL